MGRYSSSKAVGQIRYSATNSKNLKDSSRIPEITIPYRPDKYLPKYKMILLVEWTISTDFNLFYFFKICGNKMGP